MPRNHALQRVFQPGTELSALCQGRLTLAPGYPVYSPQSMTPSSTNTTSEVMTFATPHGWVTGTMFLPSATEGGLTAGVQYYLRAISTTDIAAYTTLADALADTSRVNLTANLTVMMVPNGMANQSVYWSPYKGDAVALYDGTRWRGYAYAELSLALGTLTSGLPYDVFLYDNLGTLTLELTAWTNDATRATALALQNGAQVRAGATTRRYLGTLATVSTTAVEDSLTKRFLYNEYEQVLRGLTTGFVSDAHTYGTGAFREWNAGTNAIRLQYIIGQSQVPILSFGMDITGLGGQGGYGGLGIDSTTVITQPTFGNSSASAIRAGATVMGARISPGKHYVTALEYATGAGITFSSYSIAGMVLG